MDPQQVVWTKVPVEPQSCIEEGLGVVIGIGETAAFAPAGFVGPGDIAIHTADAKIAANQEDIFFFG